MQEFCAQLRDGHSYVYRPRELSEELESKPLLKTRFVEGKVLIVSVLDESLKREGFQPGLEITALDGIAVRQYGEQRVARYVSASTRQWLDVQTYEERLLAGPKNAPVELTLLDSGGKAFNRTVPRKSPQEAAGYEEKPKLLELRPLAGNVAYVALNTFADQKLMKEFDSSFEAIQPSDALILDVRANVGGSSGIGWYVLSYLTDKPFLTFQTRERVYRPYARAAGREQRWDTGGPYEQSQHGSKFYRKPVVVLTSARTFSAAEDFAVAFVAMKRGKIIGEATGGSTGQPLSFPLPGGGRGAVCTIQDRHADGSDFVGVGVKPDIEVHPTVADVRAGRDTVLEVALQYLRKLPRE